MEVNNAKESNSMEKIEKQSNPKWWIYYKGKPTLKHFGFNEPSSGWLFGFYGISTFVGYLMPNLFLYK